VSDDFSRISTLILLAGGMGLAAYCIACALHVWGGRNAHCAEHRKGRRWLYGVGGAAVASSLLTAMAGIAVQLVLNREGLLRANDLYTVRARQEWPVKSIAEEEEVSAGAPLVWFHSPDREADLQSLRLKLDTIDLQQNQLDTTPLELDRELIRQLTETIGEARYRQANQHDFQMESSRVLRELAREELTRRDSLLQLREQIRSLRIELKQANYESSRQQQRVARASALKKQSAISQDEYDEIVSEAQIAAEEVTRRETRFNELVAAHQELGNLLENLVEVMHGQSQTYGLQLESLEGELALLESRREAFENQLDADRVRAARHRQAQGKQLEIEVLQTQAALDAIERSLCITAPHAGRILWHHPSPNTVKPGDPLVVLTQEDGVQAEFRLPSWEAHLLAQQDQVILQLVEPKTEVGELKRRFIQRRFTGSPLSIRVLPDDPGFSWVALTCDVPPDGIRTLASGDEIVARLIWVAPFYFNPTIQIAAAFLLLGATCITVAGFQRSPQGSGVTETRTPLLPVMPLTFQEAGADGVMLHLLGSQLRESVLSRELDGSLVAAAEWALDRHRARAIRLIQQAMGDPDPLVTQLELYGEQFLREGDDISDDEYHTQAALLQRVVAIFSIVVPENTTRRVKRLQRKLDDELLLSAM
jgi:hypothetical protein